MPIDKLKSLALTLSLLFTVSCVNNKPITEQEVKDTILGMFDSFSVESDNINNFKNYVTDDYVLYEIGKVMTADDFIEFAQTFNTIEDDWTISDWNISIDKNSAHAYFKNQGRFVTLNDGKKELLNYDWHESAYLVRQDGKLKIKFYFSDTINQSLKTLK
ncbi:MAG: hypothetical protein CMG35_09180 [Candidatus Marinimicrobia bacterium]|nr:hypothetical protein [Candidatus Neomarinimicrobiota bacterium]MEC8706412.1 hypothetical protein [Candidatus Neomarinimicrobiota bacterium]